MVAVNLYKIIMHENKHDQIIILREVNGARQLPIVIGVAEAAAIKMRVSKIEPPRPLTHDLMQSIVVALGGVLVRAVINKLEGNTFFARLHLRRADGVEIDIDARPSDSIALALRAAAPLFAEEEVFEKIEFLND